MRLLHHFLSWQFASNLETIVRYVTYALKSAESSLASCQAGKDNSLGMSDLCLGQLLSLAYCQLALNNDLWNVHSSALFVVTLPTGGLPSGPSPD